MGLVNRVVAKEEFWPTVYRFADAMLATQPWLIDMTKQAYDGYGSPEDPRGTHCPCR